MYRNLWQLLDDKFVVIRSQKLTMCAGVSQEYLSLPVWWPNKAADILKKK